LQDDLAHLLHARLKSAHFECHNCLGGLIHLVDGIVHRRDEILNVGAVEWRDEGTANSDQNLPGYLVGFRFALENLFATRLDLIAAAQQSAKRFGTGDNDGRVLFKKLEEALFARHERLKPAKHVRSRLIPGFGSTPTIGFRTFRPN